MELSFIAPSSEDADNTWASTSRLINLYREPVGNRVVVKSHLGALQYAVATGATGDCRAMALINDSLWVVFGGSLYEISKDRVVSLRGDADVIPDGNVSLSGNSGAIVIATGPDGEPLTEGHRNDGYIVYTGGTMQRTSGVLPLYVSGATFFEERTVVTSASYSGRKVYWSDPGDPLEFNALNFAEARSRDDKIIRPVAIAGALWIFKQRSIERWASNQLGDLAPLPGATIDRGLKDYQLLSEISGGCFFVGNDNITYTVMGGEMARISTVPVETAIQSGRARRTFYFEDEGHKFCVITFSDRPAWVYDIATGEWSERADEGGTTTWSAQAASVDRSGLHVVGYQNGIMAEMFRHNRDFDDDMIRQAVSTTFQNSGEPFKVPRLELQAKTSDYTSAPEITLEMSKDFGRTWRLSRTRSLGADGDAPKKLEFRALGQYEQATARVTISDRLDVAFDSVAFL